jgi:hypothetical protein
MFAGSDSPPATTSRLETHGKRCTDTSIAWWRCQAMAAMGEEAMVEVNRAGIRGIVEAGGA